MHVDIRRIGPDDGPILRAVRLAALTDAPSAFGATFADEAARTDVEWSDRARRGSQGAGRATFLAVSGGRHVGIAGGYREEAEPDVVHLVSMWTSPEVRRTGVGRRLVTSVIEWASDTRATSVALWVTCGNAPAQRLYEAMGFAETDELQPLPSDPCKDEVRMVLRLDR